MAIVNRNPLLEGLSGRVGDLVFRVRDGKTIVSRRPRRHRSGPRSLDRERSISRFREAVAFAQKARHSPAYRSLARLLRRYSPYHLAIQDYLSEPKIEAIDDSAITSRGGPLLVTVSERVGVRAVHASILALPGKAGTIRGERVSIPSSGRRVGGVRVGQPDGGTVPGESPHHSGGAFLPSPPRGSRS